MKMIKMIWTPSNTIELGPGWGGPASEELCTHWNSPIKPPSSAHNRRYWAKAIVGLPSGIVIIQPEWSKAKQTMQTDGCAEINFQWLRRRGDGRESMKATLGVLEYTSQGKPLAPPSPSAHCKMFAHFHHPLAVSFHILGHSHTHLFQLLHFVSEG